jgi:hypothetical protein
MSMSPVFQAESREYDARHRYGILRSLEQLVCLAQRQVIRTQQTASRETAVARQSPGRAIG